MGGPTKKLVGWTDLDGTVHKGWAHYEFGKAIGDIPGNCQICRKKHAEIADDRKRAHQGQRLEQARRGLPVVPQQHFDPAPPCERCPKYKLYPDNFGLNPANELAVQIYRMAAAEHRVGTFAGAFLLRTVSVPDVRGVMDEFSPFFATWLHRQQTFQAVLALDKVATQIRAETEEAERKRQEAKAESEAKKRK